MTPARPRSGQPGRTRLHTAGALLVAGAALTVAACGSDSPEADDTKTTKPDTTEAATDTTEAAPDTTVESDTPETTEGSSTGGAVGTLEDVRGAVIQIQAQGTFVDPEFGQYEGAGRGSGFVIDPSGIAVTNNHVVTGAGLLQVFVQGEDQPRNARVLGVSECSDLAVIQIDGAELPYVSWAEDASNVGTEVYLAGYPKGDPEYTLTRGVISKERANGDTQWASVDHTIEHDAASQGGNSGGPLVTADGRVAGVHYASNAATNQSQFFAIAPDIAVPVVEELAAGNDVDSIGVNGQIVQTEDGSVSGIWVSGVKSGSPADEIGIQPGDIITRIEGVTLGLDGTMRDYCDVLRSHAPDDQLDIDILRFATSEVLNGELNGDSLVQTFSFAEEYADEGATPAGTAYSSYVDVTDDTGSITVAIPAEWASVDGAPIDIGGVSSPSITASTDVATYRQSWEVPGMEFIASSSLLQYTPQDMLGLVAPADCVSEGGDAYDDGFFVGQYEVFGQCGGTGTKFYLVATHSADGAYGVLVAVQVVSDADLEALDAVLGSFNVVA